MILTRLIAVLTLFLCLSFGGGVVSTAQTTKARAVSGCELIRHPSRYNGRMVIVEGKDTWGFERGDLSFGCPGRVWIHLSLTDLDRSKYGFLTEKSALDAMSQLPTGERPGDNLLSGTLRFAPVVVEGLYRCHEDFPSCKRALPDDGSIIVKSMQLKGPISEISSAAKPSVSADMLLHESGHVADPAKPQ